MENPTCSVCGLVNRAGATQCHRCRSQLVAWGPPSGAPVQSYYGAYGPPPVWKWYVAYCVFLALIYGILLVAFPFLIAQDSSRTSRGEEEAGIVIAVTMIIMVPLFVAFAIAPFLPKKPWTWVYHLVLICLGMTGCTIVASIPLLIFWLKPETKAFFGRS